MMGASAATVSFAADGDQYGGWNGRPHLRGQRSRRDIWGERAPSDPQWRAPGFADVAASRLVRGRADSRARRRFRDRAFSGDDEGRLPPRRRVKRRSPEVVERLPPETRSGYRPKRAAATA